MIKEEDKIKKIVKEAIPILSMIILIVFIKKDLLFLIFGLIIITIFEYIFIKTEVETFNRNSLFGVMPLWLPILWAYAFVAIKRVINILK